jgi:hypothetical protein
MPNCAWSSKVQVKLLAPLQTAQNPCTIVNVQRCKQICKPYYNLAHDTRIIGHQFRPASKHCVIFVPTHIFP